MNRYEKNRLVKFVGEDGIEKFKNARVLILGAGGVGTNLVINMSSLGIGNIGLVDNDIIESKNLSIQTLYDESSIGKYKVDVAKSQVDKYNPHINLKIYNLRLNENNYKDIFDDYDIIVDAFDTQKSVLLENRLAVKTNKPIIFTGTEDAECFVLTTIPGITPCFACFIEHTKEQKDKEYGVFQATGAIAAGMQTMEVIKLILKKGKIIHSNPLFYDGFAGRFFRPRTYKSKSDKCDICGMPLISYEDFCDRTY